MTCRRRLTTAFTLIIALLTAATPAVANPNANSNSANQHCTSADGTNLKPFLKLPFHERDGRNSLIVSNGKAMATDEVPIAGPGPHNAVDLEFTRRDQPDSGLGLPVLAAADGTAYYSFQQITDDWVDTDGRFGPPGATHRLGYGAGLVVEIRHAGGWVTQYIHLREVAPGIPYLGATQDPPGSGEWTPSGILQPNEVLQSLGVPVKAGQIIGTQGASGVGLDQKEVFDGITGKITTAITQWWDPPQLHFQLYQGRNANMAKQNIRDVFGRETDNLITPQYNPYMKMHRGEVRPGKFCSAGWFLSDRDDQPLYAG